MRPAQVARQRRQTLHFLAQVRDFSPVFLATDVDMGAVLAHREAAREDGLRYSVVSYVLHAGARVLAAHPDANSALRGSWRPKVVRYPVVNAKLALDRTVDGRRAVLSAVLPDLATAKLAEIQRQVDHYRDGDPDTMPEFAGVRKLQRLPVPLGRLAFRRFVGPLHRRGDVFGTFAVTSLGHRAVDSFHSVGGTTVTLGVGRIAPRPVVRDGEVVVARVMRLNLSFDHRVVDGGEAADVLTEVKDALEGFEDTP
ncbi:2-oxo acid dehydrogenase subunit E2 [Umezawaea tangerina]|uniref:2-oxoacid dehydrogenase/acyltransferase catalytic subunit n=1 Tax=Umezawaea tangerina TaxID=84725 RepID=A0A2T0SN96_9PSEU|nr:2-oxo acid dehydrogenase subunit E2 [Umezawaea tangerina]PRY34875.1 2-oxoacid dehydrogenase/acyltransferase catalytic subunit [Umezawaea tangerina]